jgi:glycosyltransferase involved in cell wall biosynthesis
VTGRHTEERDWINLVADYLVYDGSGSMSEYLAVDMRRAGRRVNAIPLHAARDRDGLSQEMLELLSRDGRLLPGPVVINTFIQKGLDRFTIGEHFFHIMWESSKLPAEWPRKLNRARAVMVPTHFVAQAFRENGVTSPIEVVPDGIDPEVYRWVDRPRHRGITTLMVGVVIPRKHVEEGIQAWHLAFDGDPDARLILKARFGSMGHEGFTQPDDPRILLVDESEPTRGILHWYARADVLMALGSEGFGLPLVEGMATGLPVIALTSEGQGDVCREAGDLVLAVEPAGWESAQYPQPGGGRVNPDPSLFGVFGVRGYPDVRTVAERLRWVADNPAAARDLGRAASEWARKHRNVQAKAMGMIDVLDRFSSSFQ